TTVKKKITIPAVKPWKIYCVPFTHVDIGFTQSQKNIRIQNYKNIDIELELVEKTKHYGKDASFKLFTEVSWAVQEYLSDATIEQDKKQKLIKALQKGDFELGAFLISHQNRFMSPDAIIASLQSTFNLAKKYNVTIHTACIHDVMDFSKVTKILCANDIPYLLVGPNDTRYVLPPLFYGVSPDTSANVLVWHSAGLNGYGENFDLAMRLKLPFDEQAFTTMENSIALHLAQLEKGYPTAEIKQYFDYGNAHWDYPYDAYLLPYYPAQGGDNQPQNIVPSEIAREWNKKMINPQIIIATPSQFFDYVRSRYNSVIPRIKGEMAPFWGEQIYLDFIQADPQRLLISYMFDRGMYQLASTVVDAMVHDKPIDVDSFHIVAESGYKAILLNNDHNPRPVPFGKTHYTSDDVKDWMNTRSEWVKLPQILMHKAGYSEAFHDGRSWEKIKYKKNIIIIDSHFYRVTIDQKKGRITGVYDKELQKEWIRNNAQYGFNQYVQTVRGENGARRDYYQCIEGFKSPDVLVYRYHDDYRLIIEGTVKEYYKGMELIADFLDKSFHVSLPPWLLKVVYFFYQLFTPSLTLTQEIVLPADEKKIELIQTFSGSQPQIAEHCFAYPLTSDALYYDAAFTPLLWESIYNGGNIIPAAKNTAPFKSINDTLYPFQWMYGLPPSFHCDAFTMVRDDAMYAVFMTKDSKAIVPESSYSRDSNGFYHCCIGWTLWGKVGLGQSLKDKTVFRSTFTTFSADSITYALAKAYDKSFQEYGYTTSSPVTVSNPAIAVVWMYPITNKKFTVGLFETAGQSQSTHISIKSIQPIAVYYSTCYGERKGDVADKQLLSLKPHELRFVTIEIQ
ncbi:MAG TPA: hypothetical protein PLR54_04980, partial [Spirochaetota bacterium]|nr:hypothetical protein [Spirochaetota bacterium]